MDKWQIVENIFDNFVQILTELILHLDKFLSPQLVFTYSLLNHRMRLRTANAAAGVRDRDRSAHCRNVLCRKLIPPQH